MLAPVLSWPPVGFRFPFVEFDDVAGKLRLTHVGAMTRMVGKHDAVVVGGLPDRAPSHTNFARLRPSRPAEPDDDRGR